jgi:purine-nucleoside phosphorylase
MMITDQINLTFENPLIDQKYLTISRELYDKSIQQLIRTTAKEYNIPIQKGIYCGIKGPSYETAAEVEMIRRIGADAVGMSTVNEVSLAKSLGMRIGGISCITNLSTGILDQKLSHREVTEIANMVKDPFSKLLQGIIHKMGNEM